MSGFFQNEIENRIGGGGSGFQGGEEENDSAPGDHRQESLIKSHRAIIHLMIRGFAATKLANG